MMSKFQHDVMLRAVKFLDVILMTLPFAACWFLYYGQRIQTPLDAAGHAAVLALYAVLFIVRFTRCCLSCSARCTTPS